MNTNITTEKQVKEERRDKVLSTLDIKNSQIRACVINDFLLQVAYGMIFENA